MDHVIFWLLVAFGVALGASIVLPGIRVLTRWLIWGHRIRNVMRYAHPDELGTMPCDFCGYRVHGVHTRAVAYEYMERHLIEHMTRKAESR